MGGDGVVLDSKTIDHHFEELDYDMAYFVSMSDDVHEVVLVELRFLLRLCL